MGTIFMNSKKCGIPDPYRLLLNLTDKIYWKRCDKYVAYVAFTNLCIYYGLKNIKKS